MNTGALIAFEGIDGCGKSTQVERLVRALEAAGREVVATREPTDGPTGRRIRALARSGEAVSAEEELRCFFEDRRDHVDRVIAPALGAGRIVVTDRYFLSTVAYQGAREPEPAEILARSEAEFPLPDLALLLELPVDVALARVRARGAAVEALFESEKRLRRVAENFRALDRSYIERIDAAPASEVVHARVLECVRLRLGLPGDWSPPRRQPEA